VDTEGAAVILGWTPQWVGRLAALGRLPWLPTGRIGGQPTRVYRRARIEVIARARIERTDDRLMAGTVKVKIRDGYAVFDGKTAAQRRRDRRNRPRHR
jgi:hypothetical protein